MLSATLLKMMNVITAAVMVLQPVLGAVSPEIAKAAPAEIAPQAAAASAYPMAGPDEPLVAAVPMPETMPSSALAAQSGLQQNPDWPPADFDIEVDNTGDFSGASCAQAGECTLRAAIIQANITPGEQIIKLPAGHYELAIAGADEDAGLTGDLDVTDDLQIIGEGAETTIIDGNHLDRVIEGMYRGHYYPYDLPRFNLTLSGINIQNGDGYGIAWEMPDYRYLTVRNAIVSHNTGVGVYAGDWYKGQLVMANSLVTANQDRGISGHIVDITASTISYNMGGGILANYATIDSSTIAYNSAEYGGGFASYSTNEDYWITNSTLSHNEARIEGGAIWIQSGGDTMVSMRLLNNTIAYNTAPQGSGLYDGSPEMDTVLRNTIVAANSGGDQCYGSTSGGHNLFGDSSCYPIDGDIVTDNPLLGSLQDNGGPTPTHALLPGSPAINAGLNVWYYEYGEAEYCPSTDQRGVERPQGTTCDIGAYEYDGLAEGQTAGVREADYNFDNYGAFAQGQVAGPINTFSGKHTAYEVDLSLPALAGALSFERSYSTINARDMMPGALSPGWNHNYEVHLILPTAPATRVELYTAGGSRLGFEDDGGGTYTAEPGAGGTLTRSGTGTDTVYVYRSTADIGYTFDYEGVLQSIDDGMEHELTLVYDDVSGLLEEVYSADSERALFFDYGDDTRLDEVRTATVDEDGDLASYLVQSVSYTYSSAVPSGDLETVADVNGHSWRYEYEDLANPHFLTARYDPNDDLIVEIAYDAEGRADQLTNGAGETAVALTYGASGMTTIEYGQESSAVLSATHEYDSRNTLHSQIDGLDGETITSYDDNFRVKSVTDPNNHATTMGWSDDGADLLTVRDALNHVTTTGYDARHHPTVVTNPDGTQTHFVYNTDGAATTNPLTGEAIGNNAWDEDVLLLRIDNYQPDEIGAVDANRATRYQYNSQSLPVRITGPDGVSTCTTYTALGLPEDVTENCTSSTGLPGENAITHYTYDTLGRVVTVTDPIGRKTRYNYSEDNDSLADVVIANYNALESNYGQGVYNLSTRTYRDALGRAYATVTNYSDGTGGDLTAADIDDALPDRNLVTRVYFDAAGRVETTVTNFVGDLASATPPTFDPAHPDRNLVTRTYYDGAGRVVATIDNFRAGDLPDAGTQEPLDLDGQAGSEVTLEISPEASQYNRITLIRYDEAGRVSTTTTAAWPGKANYYQDTYNLVSMNAYDAAGNVTRSVTNYDPDSTDGNGNGFTASITPALGQTPVSLVVDPDATDRNVIACADYDALNRAYSTTAACIPGNDDDYLPAGGSFYNLVTRTYYDEMGRVYATVANYQETDGQLEFTSDHNLATRAYYDRLGRVIYTVQNFAGVINLDDTTPPVYDAADPAHNLVTRVMYNDKGYPVIAIRNLFNPSGGQLTEQEIIDNGPDRNLITLSHYNAIGQVDWTVDNFVGDIYALPETAPNVSGPSDQNLLTTYRYDSLGRRDRVTAVRGSESRIVQADFDELGRTKKSVINFQDGQFSAGAPDVDVVTETTFGQLGRIVTVQGPPTQSGARQTQRTVADALGQVYQSITDPGGLNITANVTYDAAGRAVQTVTENGDTDQVSTARYDALGRVTQTTADPGGLAISTSATYDLLGRVLTTTDPMSIGDAPIITRSFYDSLGRTRHVVQNSQGAPGCSQPATSDINVCTSTEYDAAGNVTSTTLGNGSKTTYEYDALGRVTREVIDPGNIDDHKNITTAYTYNAAGSQVLVIRAPDSTTDRQETSYTFDRLGRVTHIDYAEDTLNVTYTYDAWGNRATMDDSLGLDGRWAYRYDRMNRLTATCSKLPDAALLLSWTEADCPTDSLVVYSYDGAGQRTNLDLPDDVADVTYTYDMAGHLDTLTDPFANSELVDYRYDDAGRLDGVTLPNGVDTSYLYDTAGRLQEVSSSKDPVDLSSFTYTLDARGNRVGVEEEMSSGQTAMVSPPLGDQFSVISDQFNGTGQSPITQSPNQTMDLAASGLTILSPLQQPIASRPSTQPTVAEQSPIEQSSITQSSITQLAQSSITQLLDEAWAAGDICKRGVYKSLRQKAENAQKALDKGNDEAAANLLKALVEEVAAQSSIDQSSCIARGVADEITFTVGTLMVGAEEPYTPGSSEEHVPERPSAPEKPQKPALGPRASGVTGLAAAAGDGPLVVNSTGDGADSNTGDGVCDDGTGACTLRAAVEQADATAGTNSITFNLPGSGPYVIQPGSALPGIGEAVSIDGTTQPGYAGTPIVRLDGSSAGADVDGLMVWAGGSTISGLMIVNFSRDGIIVAGSGNTISDNFIGTDGAAALGNGRDGLCVYEAANNTLSGNLVSANGDDGISIVGGGATGNIIQNNKTGTDITGTQALGNTWEGILVDGAPGNTLSGNLTSGNHTGIYLYGEGAAGNSILGNTVGTDVTGTLGLGNSNDGVIIHTASGNTADGNLVSANGDDGISIVGGGATGNIIQNNKVGTDITGTQALGNTWEGILIDGAPGNTLSGNLTSGNHVGIYIYGETAGGNTILGNKVGTDTTGTLDLGNSSDGIVVDGAPNNTIGGTEVGEGNLVGGNDDDGIDIRYGASGNVVLGNKVGTDISGTAALGNSWEGILIDWAPGNTIGGAEAGAGNLISGNGYDGIGLNGADTTGTLVLGNQIGTDISGTAALGNAEGGITFYNAPSNTIGGVEVVAGNLISGNGASGIILYGEPSSGNLFQGNRIGVNIDATGALGNGDEGIYVAAGATGTTIGGMLEGAGNLIGGNTGDGIGLGSGTSATTIQGNFLGTDVTGTATLGNGYDGICVYESGGNTINGNLIAGNGENGIHIAGEGTTGNAIRGNRIDENDGLGINLDYDGVTANDTGDADSGPNDLQNYPVLTAATSNATSTTVDGTLNSSTSTIFQLDFYASPTCDASNHGEGAAYLGAGEATTDASGNVTFSLTVSTASTNNWAITATATDPGGNTSEFSTCVTVVSTGDGTPPQSDDPIFGSIDLPHDPALGPLWDGETLTAEQIDAYRADFTLAGVSFVGLDGEEPHSESAIFSLDALRQGGAQTTLPAPDPLTGNPDAVVGWLTQDNIVLRQRLAGLYEIAALRAEGVELAYLLTAPTGGAGDLEMVVGLDTELETHDTSVGVLLLDADGNGLHVGLAMAIDANGDSVIVPVEPDAGGLKMVVPGDWLAQAAYPILIDPYVVRWQTNSNDRTPAIAYDEARNRALVVYTSGNALYTRLVSAVDGTIIHQAQLDTFPGMTTPSVIFDSQQNEYLVVCGQMSFVSYWRVDADGYPVGGKKLLAYNLPIWSFVNSADIASAGNDAGLMVWSDAATVQGQRISLDGTRQGNVLDISNASMDSNQNAAVAYDATLNAYMVTWQRNNLQNTTSEIWATTVLPSGAVGVAFQVSDDTGKELDPDIAYSTSAGQTLAVWSSEDGDSQTIQARRLLNGTPASPVFTVGQTFDVDQFPRVAGSQINGWMVTWQRTDPDLTPPDDDVWLSLVPSDASSDLTPLNRSIREMPTANESRPAIALRGDAVSMVALVETISGASAIVLAIDEQGLSGEYAWHYTYDALGRMTFACSQWVAGDCQGDQWQYSYDGAGNRLLFDHWDAEDRTTITTQYVINGANQIECIDDVSGDGVCNDSELLWEYDSYGNLLYDGVTHYEYNAAGRLSRVIFGGSDTTYVYNGDGQRVSQTIDDSSDTDATTTYLLDIVTSAMLSATTNGQTTHYLNGLNTIAQSDGTETAYLQYDGVGSMRQMTTSSGEVQYSQTFDPAGNLYKQTEGDTSTIGFAGGTHDANGLVYANGQYYAPTQGNFIRQQLDRWDRAFSEFASWQRANTLTWEEFQAKTPQVMQGIVNRSKLAGQSPVMEALGETYIFNAKVWWESPMIQTTISQGQICITPGTTWQQRFNASREIALTTAMPIAEFGLLAYSPVTMLFPITTADVMMTTSGSDIIRLAQAQQYAEDAAAFARLRAAEAEVAAITVRYAGPNGVTIIGDGSAANARIANAYAAQAEADAMMAMPAYQVPAGGAPVYNLLGGSSSSRLPKGLQSVPGNYQFPDPVLRARYPQGIDFDADGWPNLSPYSIQDVHIYQTGYNYRDFKAARDRMRDFLGNPNWQRPPGYTWHHHQDMMTMQLVPSEINNSIVHLGGASLAKRFGPLIGPLLWP